MANGIVLNIDTTKSEFQNPMVQLRQGDGNYQSLSVTVTSNGEPFDITGWTTTFMGTTAGGFKIVDSAVTVTNALQGEFTYTPTKAWGQNQGEFKNAYFKFTKADETASGASFRVNVLDAVDLTAEEAGNYISVVDALIDDVKTSMDSKLAETKQTLADTQSQANVVQANVNDLNTNVNELKTQNLNIKTTDNAWTGANTFTSPIVGDISGSATTANDPEAIHKGDSYLNVKWFGAIGDGVNDDTSSIQAAIDSLPSGGTIFIPDGVYMIRAHVDGSSGNFLRDQGGINLKDNITLKMSRNTTLKAIPNDRQQYNIIRTFGANNVTVYGGNLLGDRDTHLSTGGEWGYGIAIMGSSNIVIKNINISKMWGDGINLQVLGSAGSQGNKNILIENVVSTYNRRQGMSVESVDGLIVRDSEFSNTSGTLPSTGIDIEPYNGANAVINMLFENNRFLNNDEAGVLMMTSAVQNATFRGNYFYGNKGKTTGNGQLTTYLYSSNKNIVISDNFFKLDGTYSMSLRGGAYYNVRNNVINRGIISDVGADGVGIYSLSLTDNIVNTNGLATAPQDVLNIIKVNKLSITRNVFDTSNVYNSRSLLNLVNIKDLIVDSNSFISSPRSLKIYDSENIKVSKNTFDNAGIFSIEISGATKDILVEGNSFYGSNSNNNSYAAIAMINTSSGLVARDNILYQAHRITTVGQGTGVAKYLIQTTSSSGSDTITYNNFGNSDGVNTFAGIMSNSGGALSTGYSGDGNGGIMISTSSQRPTTPAKGTIMFDSTINSLIVFDGTSWKTVSIS